MILLNHAIDFDHDFHYSFTVSKHAGAARAGQ